MILQKETAQLLRAERRGKRMPWWRFADSNDGDGPDYTLLSISNAIPVSGPMAALNTYQGLQRLPMQRLRQPLADLPTARDQTYFRRWSRPSYRAAIPQNCETALMPCENWSSVSTVCSIWLESAETRNSECRD